ncbi:S-adenosyl-L-methionine-dependent methyltransferase [Teratosphaeria nubilosa]|uniref:S-adenosyl-L-methionine-dependent methyltransferase n=1 Tax=Teratosphaeria nubilosa TaxID=161662 RepID=A0A6G1LC49_9PEZI|nr:S-adenosyl-L-methionine-dependent methyltransferase [Teratosphaeria nubilosa]
MEPSDDAPPVPMPTGAPIARPDHIHDKTLRPESAFSIDAPSIASSSQAARPAEAGDAVHDPVQDAQLAEEQNLEADVSDASDSAIGSDTESTTTSLAESIYNYRREHGRTYHAYKDGKYIFPNDEREADRLDLQHHLFRMTYGNRLFFAPIDNPQRCLDVGTGTGLWAMEFADDFPGCGVVGIDLSPGQPSLVPPNLKFVVDDAEDDWIYSAPFDFIHARLMAGCFADWPKFFRQAYENLEPGGWLELQDYGLPVKSADATAAGTDLMRWGELLCEAARIMGRPMGSDASDKYVQRMTEAGFVEVQQRMFMWPSCSWPKDPLMKELGRWNQINILEGLEGFCLALLTRALGWKKEEVDVFVAKVSADLRNKRIHAYFPMPVTLGRKPYLHEAGGNDTCQQQ